MSLKARLIERIAREGPIPVSEYMDLCLHDPADGYYATRPALGERGDFLTAPLVSQMFGEMLAGWIHAVWERLGAPPRLPLVELGPGDGTLMADILRAARADARFAGALHPWLVETSGPLRERQRARVEKARWVERLDETPAEIPSIIIGNEFLDCLPAGQAVWRAGIWRERRIGVQAADLAFVEDALCLREPPSPARGEGRAELIASMGCEGSYEGAVKEFSAALRAFGSEVGARLARQGGAALFVDYGSDTPGFGDTLQALRGHAKESPLANPGAADLTVHVDFPAFVEAAEAAGARAAPVETQGEFLSRLGIVARAEALIRTSPAKAEVIGRQLARLISPGMMGDLFKVCALAGGGLELP